MITLSPARRFIYFIVAVPPVPRVPLETRELVRKTSSLSVRASERAAGLTTKHLRDR